MDVGLPKWASGSIPLLHVHADEDVAQRINRDAINLRSMRDVTQGAPLTRRPWATV
jgi:hypothetical protein